MHTRRFAWPLAAVACGALAGAAFADEGMWTLDNPPIKLLEEQYNFTPTQAWLDHVRLASVRMNDGGSASFVSPHGLVLTNHHVARGQLQKISTPENDYIKDGFYAATPDQEMKSPDPEVNVLVSMENVTERVVAAVRSREAGGAVRRAARGIAQIEKETLQKHRPALRRHELYQGGEYWLYRYKKYTDIRLVLAPELQTAFYGGDPDNFTYPRYDVDMAFFRVYENGKPVASANYLKWNPEGAADGELVFVAGHPGSTDRLDTVAQLEFQRDTSEPNTIKILKSRIATLEKYSAARRRTGPPGGLGHLQPGQQPESQ